MNPKKFWLMMGMFIMLLVGVGTLLVISTTVTPEDGTASDDGFNIVTLVPIYFAAIIPILARKKNPQKPEAFTEGQRTAFWWVFGGLLLVALSFLVVILITLGSSRFMPALWGIATGVMVLVATATAFMLMRDAQLKSLPESVRKS